MAAGKRVMYLRSNIKVAGKNIKWGRGRKFWEENKDLKILGVRKNIKF